MSTPSYTPYRLELCTSAERALAIALDLHGHCVSGRQIEAAWGAAHGGQSHPAVVSGRWPWVLEPAVSAGRVTRVRVGQNVLFGIAGHPAAECLPPDNRVFGAEVGERCRRAEEALGLALQEKGAMVTATELTAAWNQCFGPEDSPEPRATSWTYALCPALEAQRVVRIRQGNCAFFGIAGHPACIVPPAPERAFGQGLVEMCHRVERALEAAIAESGEMAGAAEIRKAWELIFEVPPPFPPGRGVDRVLEPAWIAGRLRVASRNGRNYYAPIEQITLLPPQFSSDLERAEEATRRAVERLGSAVLMEEAEGEIKRDPLLASRSSAVPFSTLLGSLVRWGRLRTIRSSRQGGRRVYYTTPKGPGWVLPEAEHHLDRRFRAIMALWRAGHRRPFTTRALRRFASLRASYGFANDPPYAWTNALHHLMEEDAVVRITRPGHYYVLWAPAAEWERIAPAERQRLLYDAYRPDPALVTAPGEEHKTIFEAPVDAGPLDVAFESFNRNMRSLVAHAKAQLVAAEPCEERREKLRQRPVSLADVAHAAERWPNLVPPTGLHLRTYLYEASRARGTTKRSAIVLIGTVRNRAFFDLQRSEGAEAYVAFRAALRDAEPHHMRRSLDDLRTAIELDGTRIVVLPRPVLRERVARLRSALDSRIERLCQTMEAAPLLAEETSRAHDVLARLEAMRHELQRLRRTSSVQPPPREAPAPSLERLDIEHASSSIKGLLGVQLRVPRLLSARWPLVPVIRAPMGMDSELASPPTRTGGRPVSCYFDRISFMCYALARWGGPRMASYAARAILALGDIRDPALLIASIRDGTPAASHLPVVAALGLLDDHQSRSALVDYIERAVVGPGESRPDTSVPACEAAVYGLAPFPFGRLATTLSDGERHVLHRAMLSAEDDRLRRMAARVLRAWDEEWDPSRLLYL